MKSFKELAEELIKKEKDLNFFVDYHCYKKPNKEMELDARDQLSETRAKIVTLTQSGEYFVEKLEEIENLREVTFSIVVKIDEIHNTINKLKEVWTETK